MSLIEKIDAEIAKYERNLAEANLIKSTGGIMMFTAKLEEAKKWKEEFLSSQKEPLTIGDKIRESNESLAEFVKWQWADDRVIIRGKEFDIDDYLNQLSTGTE